MNPLIQNIYIIPLSISAILSLKAFRLRWPFQYKTFSVLLWVMFSVELFAILWKFTLHKTEYWSYGRSNYWFYNLMLIPQYLLYQAFFFQTFKQRKSRKVLLASSVLFTIFALVNLFAIQGLFQINIYTAVFAFLIAVIFSIRYFMQIKNEPVASNIKQNPSTYIFLGIFINQSANIPYLLSLPYLVSSSPALATAFFYVFLGINCLMFVLYSIAYLCPTPQQR